MKTKVKCKLSLKEAKRQLFDLIGEKIEHIPPKERRKKTERAYKTLRARLHRKNSSSGEISKASEPSLNRSARLVARSSS
jgi:hypothetical protein